MEAGGTEAATLLKLGSYALHVEFQASKLSIQASIHVKLLRSTNLVSLQMSLQQHIPSAELVHM